MKKSEEDVKPMDPAKEERRGYIKTVGALVAGLAIGGVATWLAKPAEVITGPTTTITVPGPTTTITVPGPTTPTPEEEQRRILAQKYMNAKPGDKFLLAHLSINYAHYPAIQDNHGTQQFDMQCDLDHKSLEAGDSIASQTEAVEVMIAGGAKAIVFWCPLVAAIPEVSKLCNENKVFLATSYGRCIPDNLPGDLYPYWFMEFSNDGDEMSFPALTLLMEKMRDHKKTKLLHVQSSKDWASDSCALINQGIAMAWRRYPEIQLLGHYWGEWSFDPGRKAGEEALAARTDYEAMWGHNDDQALGTYQAFKDRGIDIGPFAAARDAVPEVMDLLLKGEWFVTELTEFQYFGGKKAAGCYDVCTGYAYPLTDETIQAPRVTTFVDPTDPKVDEYLQRSGLLWHPDFIIADPEWYTHVFCPIVHKFPSELYPYDFRLLSIGKCKELGLTYDRHAANTHTANDFYYVPKISRFGNKEGFRKQIKLIIQYFLDLHIDTHDDFLKFLETLPADLKMDPSWH
jgi:ribose transport system substrate-binding protein